MPHRAAERMLRLLAEQALDHAFLMLDEAGRITWWSEGAENIFGYVPSEVVGREASMLFTPEDVAAGMPAYEREAALTEGRGEDDRWMLRQDGLRFWATGVLMPIRNEDGLLLGFGKILRNRTDLKEQLEALRNAAREMEHAAKRRDAFLGTLSHELRNPLAPIANAMALIRASLPHPPREAAYALNVVDRQMLLIGRLVDDLLDLTRVGEGKVILNLAPLVVQELVAEVAGDLGERVRARGQGVEVVASEAPLVVNGDRDRLRQVLSNLLVNASKYTPPQGHIWVKATSEGEEAVIKVMDDGVGIAPEMLPRLFELFTQVESTRADSEGGLGIGLALVKNLVALHGGTVQARSDGLGKGSEFTVRLPLLGARGA